MEYYSALKRKAIKKKFFLLKYSWFTMLCTADDICFWFFNDNDNNNDDDDDDKK